jgi:hypothetical protein
VIEAHVISLQGDQSSVKTPALESMCQLALAY